MKRTVRALLKQVNDIEKCVATQRELAERIKNKEVLLDESYLYGVQDSIGNLNYLREMILDSEVEI